MNQGGSSAQEATNEESDINQNANTRKENNNDKNIEVRSWNESKNKRNKQRTRLEQVVAES